MAKLSDVENIKGSVLLDGNDVEIIKALINDWGRPDGVPELHYDDLDDLCKKLGIKNPY